MFFTLREILDIAILTLAIGFIFKDIFRRPLNFDDPLTHFQKPRLWENMKFGIMAAAPAVILHELGHKFAAIYFGMNATLFASYMWLVIGVVLKLMNFGVIFFVPGYVQWGCPIGNDACTTLLNSSPWVGSIIAFAGPAMNLLLWFISRALLKSKSIKKEYIPVLAITKYINGFLFIINMLPIPGLDGFHFFSGIFKMFV